MGTPGGGGGAANNCGHIANSSAIVVMNRSDFNIVYFIMSD